MELKTKHKKLLKSLGHDIHPVVNIGKSNITENIVKKVEKELELHELIKIKIQTGATISTKEIAEELAAKTKSQIIKIIGFTALLFKRNEENPIIKF